MQRLLRPPPLRAQLLLLLLLLPLQLLLRLPRCFVLLLLPRAPLLARCAFGLSLGGVFGLVVPRRLVIHVMQPLPLPQLLLVCQMDLLFLLLLLLLLLLLQCCVLLLLLLRSRLHHLLLAASRTHTLLLPFSLLPLCCGQLRPCALLLLLPHISRRPKVPLIHAHLPLVNVSARNRMPARIVLPKYHRHCRISRGARVVRPVSSLQLPPELRAILVRHPRALRSGHVLVVLVDVEVAWVVLARSRLVWLAAQRCIAVDIERRVLLKLDGCVVHLRGWVATVSDHIGGEHWVRRTPRLSQLVEVRRPPLLLVQLQHRLRLLLFRKRLLN
mmetsp:Transcript_16274/g.39021  ORF Transcript_16274/g.39021 Transcript_16274/m.39021 type:complete len:328 (+) Transcript_16274:313-1296(+)